MNQVEIYFSILQRKVLAPNDFASLERLQDLILQFEKYHEQAAQPFKWKFTRRDPDNLLRKIEAVRTDKSEAARATENASSNFWAGVTKSEGRPCNLITRRAEFHGHARG